MYLGFYLFEALGKNSHLLALGRRLVGVLDPPSAENLQRKKAAGAFFGPGMQITAGRGDAGVSESGLHQMNGSTAVEGVRSMRMAEPVGRNGEFDAGPVGRLADDAEDRHRAEPSSALPLAGPEDGIVGGCVRGAEAEEQFPYRSRNLNRAGDSAFAKYGNLAAVLIGLQVSPRECAQFTHSYTGSVEEREEGPVAQIRFQAQDPVEIGLGENALRQAIPEGRHAEGAAHIERQIPEPVTECQEGFDGRERAVPAGGSQIGQGIGKLLQPGQGNLPERLPCPRAEPFDIGPVGALGMHGPAVEPDVDELVIGVGARRLGDGFDLGDRFVGFLGRGGKGDVGGHGDEGITKAG